MRKTLLVVDDDPITRQVAAQILQTAGFEVLTACDGKQALEICLKQEQLIDLVLTDIQMPNMNGIELTRCLADHLPDLPIILMSGHTSASQAREILLSKPGMNERAILAKPFVRHQLIEIVEALFRRSNAKRSLKAAHAN